MRTYDSLFLIVATIGTTAGCGPDASFGTETNRTAAAVAPQEPEADAVAALPPEEALGAAPVLPPEGSVLPPVVTKANAPEKDVDALNKCLAKWKEVPFPPNVTDYKKIVSVTVGGYGVPVNDTVATTDPVLVLVVAGVNVGGAPVMNLLNPNAYYCMMVGVNVDTDLTVNLHCGAHLADPAINVNVGSEQDGQNALIGVDVNSKITVNTLRPDGAACIR